MIPLELLELAHNLQDRDYDINGKYNIDKAEADKIVKAIETVKGVYMKIYDLIEKLEDNKA